MRRRALVGASAALLAAASLALGGCSSPAAPSSPNGEGEQLSSAQALQLAQARFRLGSSGTFSADVRSGQADDVKHYTARLTVDTSEHRAWGTLLRGPEKLAVSEDVALSPSEVIKRQDGTWVPGANAAGLQLVFSLASDRPENEQLLRQSGARYLGDARVGETPTSVFRLPSGAQDTGRSRLWVDADGDIKRLDDGSEDFAVDVVEREPTKEPADAADLLSDLGAGK